MLSDQIKDLAVVFMVQNLARTLRFYRDTLGLSFEIEDVEGGYLQARGPGNVSLVFFAGEATRGTTPQLVFGLSAGGIATLAERMAMAGVELVTEVSEAPGGWSVDFKDPDGHLLSLYQDGALPLKQ